MNDESNKGGYEQEHAEPPQFSLVIYHAITSGPR